jgi:predicted Zn-dependent protease
MSPVINAGLETKPTKGAAPEEKIEFREAVEHLKNEYPDKALPKLRRLFDADKKNPFYSSFLGLSLARAEQKWDEASELCETAIRINPKEIQFHMNLVEVFALAGKRERALHTVESALKLFGNDARLRRARNKVIKRRSPVLPFFGRNHFLNRYLGKWRHKLLKKFED